MKAITFVVPILFLAGLVHAQDDTKAKLGEAVAAAQKAYDAGNLDRAEEVLRGVRALVHDDFRAVMLRAKVNYDLGEFGNAVTFAQRAAELQPSDLDAHLLTGKSLFQQAEKTKADPLASGSRVAGFYESALAEFERCLQIKPDNPEILVWKAQCLFWLNRVPESVAVYEALRKARPDDPEPCLHLAQAHLAAGNADAAVKIATEGLTAKGASTVRGDLATLIFNVLSPAQKNAELLAAFKAWSAAHPSDPQAWLWLGYLRVLEKNYDEAIAHYQKGFDASGRKHSGCALEMGNALVQKERPDLAKAAEWYGMALKLQPQWPVYETGPLYRLNGVAGSLVQKRDYAKAIELLEKNAFPAAEGDWKTLNNLGLFYRDWADSGKKSDYKARSEKALENYAKASKLVVDDPQADASLKAGVVNDTGVIYDYHLGNIEKGIEYYREALRHDPKWKDALENLGRCFNKLGKYEEAIPLFEKVLNQEPGRRVSQNGLAEAKKAVEKDQKPTSR